MLQLLINGEAVDLLPDAAITIEEESPVFEKDTIPGGYSYPFSLPITPRNRRILGHPERIEKRGSVSTDLPFTLWHNGTIRMAGNLIIKDAGTAYKANLVIGTGSLATRIKDKKLQDLDLGGTRTWEWLSEYRYPDSDFALFPVNNGIFFQATEPDAGYTPVNTYRINAWESGAFYNDPGSIFAVTPFPFLGYIIRRIFAQYGFQIMGNCLESNPDFRDLCLYTNYDITSSSTTEEYVEVVVGVNEFGDEITANVLQVSTVREVTTFDMVKCLPVMAISDFLLSLRNLLNISFIIDHQDHVWIVQRQDLISRQLDADITTQAIGSPLVTSPAGTSGFKLAWEHDEHDLIFRDQFKKIDDVLDRVKDPVLDFTALAAITPELNEIRFVGIMNSFYQFAQVGETTTYTWQKFGIGYQNYLSGEMQEVFETKISTLTMDIYQRGEEFPQMRIPRTDQLRNSIEVSTYNPFTCRLLFYRGMQTDSNNDPYPMGSNDNLDRTGNLLTGKTLTLKWDGDYGLFGLYQILWRRYLTWWMNRVQVTWTIKDPSALRFDQIYGIQGNHFVLKQRSVTLTDRGVEPGECEFYLV